MTSNIIYLVIDFNIMDYHLFYFNMFKYKKYISGKQMQTVFGTFRNGRHVCVSTVFNAYKKKKKKIIHK